MRVLFVALLLVVAIGVSASAQDSVYLIRHGEKELAGTDPSLTTEGRERASDWAQMLRHAGLNAINTSDARRTQETGRIIANALDLQTSALPKEDIASLVDTLEFDHEANTVLVVAHAETIPRILENLGVLESITIGQSEFANLFIVLRPSSDDPIYMRLQMP